MLYESSSNSPFFKYYISKLGGGLGVQDFGKPADVILERSVATLLYANTGKKPGKGSKPPKKPNKTSTKKPNQQCDFCQTKKNGRCMPDEKKKDDPKCKAASDPSSSANTIIGCKKKFGITMVGLLFTNMISNIFYQ